MAKLYEEYALISSGLYNTYEKILEEKTDDLDKNLLQVMLQNTNSDIDRSSEYMKVVQQYSHSDMDITSNNANDNNVETESSYPQLSKCFQNEGLGSNNIENSTSVPSVDETATSQEIINDSDNQSVSEIDNNHLNKGETSVLDASRKIKKRKRELLNELEQSMNGDGLTHSEDDGGDEKSTDIPRRSMRNKKPSWKTLK